MQLILQLRTLIITQLTIDKMYKYVFINNSRCVSSLMHMKTVIEDIRCLLFMNDSRCVLLMRMCVMINDIKYVLLLTLQMCVVINAMCVINAALCSYECRYVLLMAAMCVINGDVCYD